MTLAGFNDHESAKFTSREKRIGIVCLGAAVLAAAYFGYDQWKTQSACRREYDSLPQVEIIRKYDLDGNQSLSPDELAKLFKDYELKRNNLSS